MFTSILIFFIYNSNYSTFVIDHQTPPNDNESSGEKIIEKCRNVACCNFFENSIKIKHHQTVKTTT